MSSIFGGSKSKSVNTNKDILNSAFQPLLGQAVASNNTLNMLLGGDATGFNKFKDAVGYDFELNRGLDNIGSATSGRGVFRSGARDKAIQEFGQGLNDRFAERYINSLLGQSGQALGAGQIVAGAGQQQTSKQKNGIGGFLGQIAGGAMAASDERLKTDIVPVGKNADGLTVYQYRYKGADEIYTGVMAQEVAKVKPEALGPTINGYMTVDYSKVNVLDRSE